MGLDIGITKIKNFSYKTNIEMELNDWKNNDEEEICYWRKHYWLSEWFTTNCKNSIVYDDFILEKEDIINFKQFCENIITSNLDLAKFNLKEDDFYCYMDWEWSGEIKEDMIVNEIKQTIMQLNKLLEEDFNNNTLYFWHG